MGYLRTDGKDPIRDQVDALYLDSAHNSYIFPEDTDETVTFVAGNVNHTWSAWTEIADNNAVTFSSKVTSDTHISAVLAEKVDTINKSFAYEIAYGAAKTVIARARFASASANKGNPIQEARIRADNIPTGETVYYRMKCETADAEAEMSIRYHHH